jgi:uncharacterized membrane protein YhaH (DUF805 family)
MFRFLSGRTNRLYFWIGLLCAAITVVIASFFVAPERLAIPVTVVWLMWCGRRLHDIGRTAFWAWVPAIISGALGAYAIWQLRQPVVMHQGATLKEIVPLIQQKETLTFVLLAAGGLVQLAFTVVIGVLKGDAGDNRFGPMG